MQKKLSLIALMLALSACSETAEQPAAAPVAVAAAPQSTDGWAKKAKFDTLRGDFASAAQSYEAIVQADPNNREARLALADSYRHLGEYDKAFGIYADLLKADPSLLAAKEGGAITLISKGDYDSSVTLLDEVIKADPKRPAALSGMGVLFTTRNLQGDAQQYFNEALKFSPNNPSYWLTLVCRRRSKANTKPHPRACLPLRRTPFPAAMSASAPI